MSKWLVIDGLIVVCLIVLLIISTNKKLIDAG